MAVQFGARLSATRLHVEGAPESGLVLHSDAEATLEDVVLSGVRSPATDFTIGHAIHAEAGATVTADRLLIEDVDRLGVSTTEATAELRDVTIHRVRSACTREGCTPFGYAVATERGALSLTRFEIHEADTCGAFLFADAGGADVDLRDGVIASSTIGACVQVPSYDFGRLQADVIYRDNGANLEATMLPVPEGAATVETEMLE
ncbi:MAG: hypothetical protein GWO04_32905 [Actinobacteria bacterium]|nr:hypothetical protein [Actinomycetota bacterium]NIW31094.1 hypothetical protein [Actinomycetota bacterium]